MDLDSNSKGKKKNNQTCIRVSERNAMKENEMWRIINATFFPFFMDARPREGTLMISQGMKSTWREKEKERVLQSAGKFALKVKRKDWFLFFGNTISKNCTNTGNTCKTYYYWNAASLIWRTTLFVSKAIRSNELAVDEHSRGERGHLLTKILVTMKPGREIIPYLYDDPKFRAGREPIPGGIYIYRFNKITRSANGELHTTGKTWIGDNPRNPSC